MKTSYLFPYRFKKVSGIVFGIAVILLMALLTNFNDFEQFQINVKVFAIADTGIKMEPVYFGLTTNNIVDEIILIVLIISGLIYAFSKEKTEDEMVSKIRLDSLVWATYFNYIFILFCYAFIYGFAFLSILIIALFSHLLFFIIRFRWMMYRQNKLSGYEE